MIGHPNDAASFPENAVQVCREYIGGAPSDQAAALINALFATLDGAAIPERNQFPPHNRINRQAFIRRGARIRLSSLLRSLIPAIQHGPLPEGSDFSSLAEVYDQLRKHEFDLAKDKLGKLPPPTRLFIVSVDGPIPLTISDMLMRAILDDPPIHIRPVCSRNPH